MSLPLKPFFKASKDITTQSIGTSISFISLYTREQVEQAIKEAYHFGVADGMQDEFEGCDEVTIKILGDERDI